MRTVAFLLLFGMLVAKATSQMIEPYGDMTKPVMMIIKVDATALEKKIIQNLGQLEGIEMDGKTGGAKFDKEKWRSHFPQMSWMATNAAQMDLEIIKAWWTPPKPRPQKISDGGGDIKPVRSEIRIYIGCLKTNRQASVVQVEREWTYNARNHFPYTEIPLWRSDSSNWGSYDSDSKWLRRLFPEEKYYIESDAVVYSSSVLDILKTLSSE